MPMRIAWFNQENMILDQPFIIILMQDCTVEVGKQWRRFELVIDSDLS